MADYDLDSSVTVEMRLTLLKKLKTLPAAPGVYFHKSADGEVIYVGKAAVLKNRVRQYFQNTEKDTKTRALVREIADTDWITVDTEMDALFLESEMIKRYRPRWNILLRDDKTVTYVRINFKDEVPHISTTRTPQDDGAEYYGPYYGKKVMESALRILRKVFPYYDKPYDGKKTLNTDLGLTPGIEVGKSTPAEYKRSLRRLGFYMNKGSQAAMKKLQKEMEQAATEEKFEEAAELRKQLFGLRELQRKIVFSDKEFMDISNDQALRDLQQMLGLLNPPARIEGYDISHQSGENVVGSMVVFTNGVSDRSKYRKFKLRKQQNNDIESMREVLTRRLKHLDDWGWPDLIVLDGAEAQVNTVLQALETASDEVLADVYGDKIDELMTISRKIKKIPVIGRDKSGDHGRNARVVLVIPKINVVDDKSEIEFERVVLPSDSHVAKLIARVDEESHRFAITYHTHLKNKKMLK